jgi:hypothetical protein
VREWVCSVDMSQRVRSWTRMLKIDQDLAHFGIQFGNGDLVSEVLKFE